MFLVSKLLYDLCQDHLTNLTDLIADIIMIHPRKALRRLLPLFDIAMEVGPEKYFFFVELEFALTLTFKLL